MDCVTDHVSTLGCRRSLTRQASRDCRAPGACAPAPVRVIILPAPAVGQAMRLGLPKRAGFAPPGRDGERDLTDTRRTMLSTLRPSGWPRTATHRAGPASLGPVFICPGPGPCLPDTAPAALRARPLRPGAWRLPAYRPACPESAVRRIEGTTFTCRSGSRGCEGRTGLTPSSVAPLLHPCRAWSCARQVLERPSRGDASSSLKFR